MYDGRPRGELLPASCCVCKITHVEVCILSDLRKLYPPYYRVAFAFSTVLYPLIDMLTSININFIEHLLLIIRLRRANIFII